MNPGTFYLYEYENNKRRRNVGFIKTARHYRSCILQIHAAGIPAGNGASLELYAFFRNGQELIAEQIAVLNCFRRNIAARLPVAEATFPEGRSLAQIDGFLICLPGSRHPLFWMASDRFFDVDIGRMKILSREPSRTDIRAAEKSEIAARPDVSAHTEIPAQPEAPARAETPAPSDGPAQDEAAAQQDTPAQDGTPAQQDTPAQDGTPAQQDTPAQDGAAAQQDTPAQDGTPAQQDTPAQDGAAAQQDTPARPGMPSLSSAEKIRHSDIARLPRKFWPLANNSFLLHGYHNYNHLMLIEEGGRTWLGVPGIYAPQEARAADLFGFPRFTRSFASFPGLSAEERSDSGNFGHWCRCVGACRVRAEAKDKRPDSTADSQAQ